MTLKKQIILAKYQELELLGHMVYSVQRFQELPKCLGQCLHHLTLLSGMLQSFDFSTPLSGFSLKTMMNMIILLNFFY